MRNAVTRRFSRVRARTLMEMKGTAVRAAFVNLEGEKTVLYSIWT
jgi:hypothetical protein